MSDHGTRARYNWGGCRCRPCTDANTRAHSMYLLGYSPRLIDPTGTRRRVRALVALGWTYQELADACGRTSRNWARELTTAPNRIREDTAAEIAAVYERLCHIEPTGPYRNRGRSIAAGKGWHLPRAWHDIDDPAEKPDAGYSEYRPHHELDMVVVERILAGDWPLARTATVAERNLVVDSWTGTKNELERLTKWNVARYGKAA